MGENEDPRRGKKSGILIFVSYLSFFKRGRIL
jgi:hypothetical protein